MTALKYAVYLAIALHTARATYRKIRRGTHRVSRRPTMSPGGGAYALYVGFGGANVVFARTDITDYDEAISACIEMDKILSRSVALPWNIGDLPDSFHFIGDGKYEIPIPDYDIRYAATRLAANSKHIITVL